MPYPTMGIDIYQNFIIERIEGCRIIRGRLIYNVKWQNYGRPTRREFFNNVYIAIDAINAFYAKYLIASGRAIWELFKKNPDDAQFNSDEDSDEDLFVFQDAQK